MHKFVALCSLVAVAGCASKPTVMPALSKTADIVRPSVAETAAVNDATITSLEAATMQMAGAVVAQANKAFVKQAESVALQDTQLASAPVLLDPAPPQTAAPNQVNAGTDLVAVAQSGSDLKQPVRPEPVMRPEPIAAPDVDDANDAKDNTNGRDRKLGPPASSIADTAAGLDGTKIDLDAVIDSVYLSYPLLEAAIQQRTIAFGEQMQALGEFDLKLMAASENQPTGFYETYRQRAGFVQPRYEGGNFFGGYRIGRGNFEPWYEERETNEAGELRAGLAVPLARDRRIDASTNDGQRCGEPTRGVNWPIQTSMPS